MGLTVVINTRKDLDHHEGSSHHEQFMRYLAGTTKRIIDVAEYPENYHAPDYKGAKVEPVWQEIEDLSTLKRFDLSIDDVRSYLV